MARTNDTALLESYIKQAAEADVFIPVSSFAVAERYRTRVYRIAKLLQDDPYWRDALKGYTTSVKATLDMTVQHATYKADDQTFPYTLVITCDRTPVGTPHTTTDPNTPPPPPPRSTEPAPIDDHAGLLAALDALDNGADE